MSLSDYLQQSIEVLQQTLQTLDPQRMEAAIAHIVDALRQDRPLLVFGNGGSAADAEHITGELVGRFLKERRGLNAICLSSNTAVLTAWSNDYSYETIFARQVEAYGRSGGVALGLSTSGNSPNVIKAFKTAHTMGMTTVALTGAGGGKMASVSDVLLDIPSRHTPLIQQAHICLYHYLCQRIEEALTM
ncbi:Phosphoheptose isomerase [Azospirillaceae bacterium]